MHLLFILIRHLAVPLFFLALFNALFKMLRDGSLLQDFMGSFNGQRNWQNGPNGGQGSGNRGAGERERLCGESECGLAVSGSRFAQNRD